MKPKVYLGTTIPSLLTAWPSRDLIIAADQQVTREWWRTRRRDFELFISQVVLNEAAEGDKAAAAKRLAEIHGLPIGGQLASACRQAGFEMPVICTPKELMLKAT